MISGIFSLCNWVLNSCTKRLTALLISLLPLLLVAQVVINELCYDPPGADLGKEWIELYNAGTYPVDLAGYRIYSGGRSYSLDYVFPHFILRPGRFVLVGGDEVPNCHFRHNFRFQNGGGASDAICFVNADSSYTDTLIYDEPNSNYFLDDTGDIATSFAPDAPQGYSLARIADGYDTNRCGIDFIAEANPTPGLPNYRRADYGIAHATLANGRLKFWIVNHSLFSPLDDALLKVWQEESLICEENIRPIAALDSLYFERTLSDTYTILNITISLSLDPNPTNDSATLYAEGYSLQAPILNEIFAKPQAGKQEWLELYQEAAPRGANSYVIMDAAGNRTRFTLPEYTGYFVICRDKEALQAEYPNCPSERIISSSGWATLNDTGDELYLWDEAELELLDSTHYTAQQVQEGKSWERHIDSAGEVFWRFSIAAEGASPGRGNPKQEILPQDERLKVQGSPFAPQRGEKLTISYKLPDASSQVNLEIYDLKGRKQSTLAKMESIGKEGYFQWDGRMANGAFAPRGVYILLWESQATGAKKLYKKQLSAVVK
ncbi:MAG: lamin tail domain-containing protein [Candidatus Cloacimonadaceae bacterium]